MNSFLSQNYAAALVMEAVGTAENPQADSVSVVPQLVSALAQIGHYVHLKINRFLTVASVRDVPAVLGNAFKCIGLETITTIVDGKKPEAEALRHKFELDDRILLAIIQARVQELDRETKAIPFRATLHYFRRNACAPTKQRSKIPDTASAIS